MGTIQRCDAPSNRAPVQRSVMALNARTELGSGRLERDSLHPRHHLQTRDDRAT